MLKSLDDYIQRELGNLQETDTEEYIAIVSDHVFTDQWITAKTLQYMRKDDSFAPRRFSNAH